LNESCVQHEDLKVNGGKNYPDGRAKQQPAEREPQAIARHFTASQGTAKIERVKLVEAGARVPLLRKGVIFAWQFPARFSNGFRHDFLQRILDF
jgi:hypothetical protein